MSHASSQLSSPGSDARNEYVIHVRNLTPISQKQQGFFRVRYYSAKVFNPKITIKPKIRIRTITCHPFALYALVADGVAPPEVVAKILRLFRANVPSRPVRTILPELDLFVYVAPTSQPDGLCVCATPYPCEELGICNPCGDGAQPSTRMRNGRFGVSRGHPTRRQCARRRGRPPDALPRRCGHAQAGLPA